MSTRSTDGSTATALHPFLHPDILLTIVDLILTDAHDAEKRWRRLNRIALVAKSAYFTLTQRASLWQWVDTDPRRVKHHALFRSRVQGLELRPAVMYTGDGDYQHSRLGRWSKIFAEASPPLIPGMLVVKDSGEHAFPTLETMPLDLWSNLTVLIMKNVGGYIPAYSQPLPLWRFPRLQHLAVAAKTPELEEPTSESKDIEPPLFPSLIHLTVIISGGQNVWNWAAALPYFPNLKTLGLYGFTYSGPEEPKVLNLPSVESFTLSPASRIPEEYPVRTRMPSLKHATFFAPDTNRIIEEVLDPVNFQEMISSWPQLEHLSLIGSATQLGWPDHLNAVKGHLPPSLRSIRMLWDLKRESMPEKWAGKYTDMARDAAIACLRAYKEQHGRPLSLWEYAVTPDSSAPPELLGTADDANERLLLEYRIVTNHVCGDDARPEDNPFLLCGKSTH